MLLMNGFVVQGQLLLRMSMTVSAVFGNKDQVQLTSAQWFESDGEWEFSLLQYLFENHDVFWIFLCTTNAC